MLITEIDCLSLTCRGSARLPEWLGTELSGMVKEHFKRRVCKHHDYVPGDESPLPECEGCSLRVDCPYARVFEPFVPRADGKSQDDPTRPVVLAAEYPSARDVSKGSSISFRLLLIDAATKELVPLLQAIDDAGQRHGLGPKRQRVKVELKNFAEAPRREYRLNLATLPTEAATTRGFLPRVRVQLNSPLRLMRSETKGVKHLNEQPECRDLVDASLRVIQRLTQISGESFAINKDELLSAASQVAVLERATRPVGQTVQVNQGSRRMTYDAITGSLTLADVPLSLLPWLYWGGKLHVGDRRAAGAGGWQLVLE